MAKRFRDTELWKKRWFRELGPEGRDLWGYLHDNCNNAGILDVDCPMFSAYLGYEVTMEKIQKVLRGKFIRISEDTIFLPAFISFQYGRLSEKSKPHISVIGKLKDEGIWEIYCQNIDSLSDASDGKTKGMEDAPKGIHTLKEKDKAQAQDKDKDKDKEKDKEKEKGGSENSPAADTLPFRSSQEPRLTPDHVVDAWNRVMIPKGFRSVSSLGSGKWNDHCLEAIKYLKTTDQWEALFVQASASSYLRGQNERGWVVNLRWLVNYDQAQRVIDGEFDDANAAKVIFATMRTEEAS